MINEIRLKLILETVGIQNRKACDCIVFSSMWRNRTNKNNTNQ